ncbi:universal stress protein [Desulfohalovibrio reitneri]|uniref:universal stress protein n=1 Tax=Desulfohalovibrio reitneri TaxID=1307759 RepID=UPI0004A74A41|nr:universal stress protein [Desulfohalovibrio reitneri]
MLEKAAIKVSLKEPRAKFLDMMRFLKSFGTSTVHLVHVYSGSSGKQEERQRQLDKLAAEVRELGFTATATAKRGHVSYQTIATSRELEVDYLGIYWLPKAVLVQALLGSIDSDILRLSDVPVFVYNRRLMNASTQLKRVLYATDFQATDKKVIPYLRNQDFQAEELVLLHVGERAPDPATEHTRQQCVQDNLERLAGELRHAYSNVKTLQVVGNQRKQILRQAYLHKVDLIVVGKADKPKPLKALLGSTAEILPDKSRRSVFIIPGYH